MIQQIEENSNPKIDLNASFVGTLKELGVAKLLNKCGIRKTARTRSGEGACAKRTAYEIFQFLLLIAFQGCNLYRFLGSKKQDIACSKSTYQRFMGNEHYNWRRFITLLASKIVGFLDTLTKPERFRALVLDDSVIGRNRSKKVELLAFVFDHVINKTVRGFNLLTLGWTDGFSFIPLAFNMLTSAKKSKRFTEMNADIDRRSVGFKNRRSAMLQKTDAAIAMVDDVLAAGIHARCILMDTWFTNEPFIRRLLDRGLDVIGMLKDNRQMYHHRGRLYGLKALAAHFARFNTPDNILGSVVVRTRRNNIPVRLVFVRNRNKRDEYIVILSTDCSLSCSEVIRRYGYRWSIECCFKVCKSLLGLGSEFQPVSYDVTVSSTALVLTRFLVLEWIRRKNSDFKSLGEIFFFCCDDVRDIELSDALESLVSIMSDGLTNGEIQMSETVRKEIVDWYLSQPQFIRRICVCGMAAAGLMPIQKNQDAQMSTAA